MATVLINAFFKDEGVPVTGLSPAIDIWNLDTDTLAVDGAAMSEVGGGNYKYNYTSYDPTVNYSFIADGGAGLANAERYLQSGNDDPTLIAPKLPTNFIMGSAVQTDKDDEIAAILADTNELQTDWADGGRLDLILDSAAAGASPLAIADAVWDEALSGHATAGSTGEALSNSGSAGDPWATSLPGSYGAGTAGKIVGDNINATVSSRSSHSAADVWAAGTRTLTSFGTLIADIWAYATRTLSSFGSLVSDIWANGTRTITGGTVTTNSDKTGYSISGAKTTLDALNDISTAQVNSEVDTALADIHLDHLLAADYDPASKPGTSTALLNELIGNDGGVSQFTANALELAPTGGSAPTAAQIADAVLEELLADHDDTNGSLAEAVTLIRKLLQNRVRHSGTTITIYDDDGTTPLFTRTPKDKSGNAINSSSYDANIPAEVTSAA